jgi:hypothetical protein
MQGERIKKSFPAKLRESVQKIRDSPQRSQSAQREEKEFVFFPSSLSSSDLRVLGVLSGLFSSLFRSGFKIKAKTVPARIYFCKYFNALALRGNLVNLMCL